MDNDDKDYGWVKIWRKIMNNWVWEDKPFSKGQAWIELIMLAQHKDTKKLIGAGPIDIKRGSLPTTQTELARRWGWSRTKVNRFLEELKADNMIQTDKF